MMRCPRCKQEVDLVEMIMDNDLQTMFSVLPTFGAHSRLAWEYCELFDVVPISKKMKKLARLLAEVAALFAQQKFCYQKREYAVTTNGIIEALKTVCNKGFNEPLQNHNYLKKVLIGIAEKEQSESQFRRESELRRKEKGERLKDEPSPTSGPKISAEEFKRRQGISSLVEKVGRGME